MIPPVPFSDFVSSLADLGRVAREDEALRQLIQTVTAELGTEVQTRTSLAALVSKLPEAVPILASAAGLSREMLKNQLRHRAGSSGWATLAKNQPERLIAVLDEFGLIEKLNAELQRAWTYADVLLERALWSHRGASSAIGRGRGVEDRVEAVVIRLGVPLQLRTRFLGRGGESAPCDLALPTGGDDALIVIAMKGFNSTGSRLTDAVREIERMAAVRRPNQFVFAVIDGIGWKSRQADLKRIHDLWNQHEIDGLYSLAHLDRFEADLRSAITRVGLVRSE